VKNINISFIYSTRGRFSSQLHMQFNCYLTYFDLRTQEHVLKSCATWQLLIGCQAPRHRLQFTSRMYVVVVSRSIASLTDASASQRKWSRERWRECCTIFSPPSTKNWAFPKDLIFWYSWTLDA